MLFDIAFKNKLNLALGVIFMVLASTKASANGPTAEQKIATPDVQCALALQLVHKFPLGKPDAAFVHRIDREAMRFGSLIRPQVAPSDFVAELEGSNYVPAPLTSNPERHFLIPTVRGSLESRAWRFQTMKAVIARADYPTASTEGFVRISRKDFHSFVDTMAFQLASMGDKCPIESAQVRKTRQNTEWAMGAGAISGMGTFGTVAFLMGQAAHHPVEQAFMQVCGFFTGTLLGVIVGAVAHGALLKDIVEWHLDSGYDLADQFAYVDRHPSKSGYLGFSTGDRLVDLLMDKDSISILVWKP